MLHYLIIVRHMKIDGKQLLERLAAAEKSDRGRITLYLSKTLYEDFKKGCGKVPVSVVIEEMMREFLKSLKK